MDNSSSPNSNTKILIIEDDTFLRELYSETLTSEGYQVDTAADGEEGYEKLKQDGWDLVLLDIILPKMDGLAVMKKLKENQILNPTKSLIFLTNLDKDEEIKEALQYGDGYLIKSQITPGDLINEVKMYIAKKASPSN